MKKLMALAATLAMAILAAAPAMAQSSAVEGQYGEAPGGASGKPVTATGVVEPLGSTTFMYGTHDLAGSGYVMNSETVDLSAYEGETATVSGTLAIEEGELEGGPPMIEVSSIETSGGGEEPGGEEISGTVLEVREGSVLVEDASGGQYDFAITGSTGFVDGLSYIPENVPPRAPTAADLAPGLEVSVVPAGPIAESFPAQGEAASITFLSPWHDGDGGDGEADEKSLSGVVTSIGDGSIIVSENPSLGVEDSGYCDQAISFSLTDGTEVFAQNGGELVGASAEDLAEGQPVEVAYTEIPGAPEIAICPPQREADTVVILEGSAGGEDPAGPPNGGGNDGGDGDNGSGDNGSGGSDLSGGVAALLGVSTLPDTGGAFLPALGFGAALVAGGLLVRRMSR